ncbi:MAG TPA: right-handed parallel beta-helix repeat-containing protein, partial [Terracidiphilus sp.]
AVNIAGATGASYTTQATTAALNGAKFDVVVSNSTGNTTSATATLTVNEGAPPTLSAQPQDQSVLAGAAATFSVTATGTGTLSYQWRQNAANIAGATGTSYITQAATAALNGASFDVVITDAAGCTTSAAATLTVTAPAGPSYYVAVNGSDTADGSASAPFATLGRAQRAMRQSPIKTTQIYGGTYYLSSQLTLTALDMGETWEAVTGAKVVISGGQLLSGWTSQSGGVYSTKAAQPVGIDLEVGGVRQMPATLGYDPQRPFISGWRKIPQKQASNFGVTFEIDPADMTASVKPGAILQEIDFLRYTDQITKIVNVDADNNTITVADQFNTGSTIAGTSGSWRILSDPADLSAPGQFAYDAATSTVYLETMDGDDPSPRAVVSAELSTLITLNNVSRVTISGLTFADTASDRYNYAGIFLDKVATIMATDLSNSAICNNSFVNAGNGISLIRSSNNSIAGNSFEQIGGSGILLTTNSNHNSVTHNSMTGLGRINLGSTGIHLENSANNTIDSNTIDGSGRWGVDLFPSDGVSLVKNTVSNNIIRNTSQQTNDTGAIYSYAGTSPGYVKESTVITGNRIENLGGLLRDSDGNYKAGSTFGIYMDDQVSGVTMTNNVMESNGSGMFLCHGCAGNSASNNVVILQGPAQYDRGAAGISYSTGDMIFKGTTSVGLMPSYFPAGLETTTIVVQLSGQASGNTGAEFSVSVDGEIIGTGIATEAIADYAFTTPIAPHKMHQIGIALTNGATSGTSTTALHNLALFVNNTAVNLVAPEATGNYGAYGLVVGNDALLVTNFSSTNNIIFRDGGSSEDLMDWTDWSEPSYRDPNPGVINYNVMYQGIAKAGDTIFGSQPVNANSALANPMFNNANAGDYTLEMSSPAVALGFNTDGVPLAP